LSKKEPGSCQAGFVICVTSSSLISAEQRQKMGVTAQMVRLSVGIESAEDLIADLEYALDAVGARQSVSVG
jgi:cystathionine beta-lyase/cystathionine gamma-synthase